MSARGRSKTWLRAARIARVLQVAFLATVVGAELAFAQNDASRGRWILAGGDLCFAGLFAWGLAWVIVHGRAEPTSAPGHPRGGRLTIEIEHDFLAFDEADLHEIGQLVADFIQRMRARSAGVVS